MDPKSLSGVTQGHTQYHYCNSYVELNTRMNIAQQNWSYK